MSYMYMVNENISKKAIILKDSVYHSYCGEYFLGQTEIIRYRGELRAWGGLFNPSDSKVNMFLNAYTVSNFSDYPITAEGWLSSRFSGKEIISRYFAAGNQAIVPPRQPKILIKSANFVTDEPTGGTYTFVRRIESGITLTKHDFQGMYIISPGSSFVLYFLPPGEVQIDVRIAFGWWEEAVCDK